MLKKKTFKDASWSPAIVFGYEMVKAYRVQKKSGLIVFHIIGLFDFLVFHYHLKELSFAVSWTASLWTPFYPNTNKMN